MNEMQLKNPDNGPFYTEDLLYLLTGKAYPTPTLPEDEKPPIESGGDGVVTQRCRIALLTKRKEAWLQTRADMLEVIAAHPNGITSEALAVFIGKSRPQTRSRLRDMGAEGVVIGVKSGPRINDPVLWRVPNEVPSVQEREDNSAAYHGNSVGDYATA